MKEDSNKKEERVAMKRQVLISTLLALAIIMAAPLTVNAQAKSGASGAGPSPFGEDEESYDVESSDTRDTGAKYDEALPLKKKAKVVQKKLYNRKFRWELGPYFGINPADSFVFSIVEGARLNFSFAEMMGVQLVGGYMQSFDRDDTTLLTDTVDNGGLEIDEDFIKNSKTQWFVNADFVWYPAYGKFSLASSVIVNYDVSLYAGAGVMGMDNGDLAPAPDIGLGANFYILKWLSLRADFMYYVAIAEDKRTKFTSTSGSTIQDEGTASEGGTERGGTLLRHNYFITLGVSFHLPPK